jgi:hypothetical protein
MNQTKITVTFDIPISSEAAAQIVRDALHDYRQARVGAYGSAIAYVEARYPLLSENQQRAKAIDVSLNIEATRLACIE